MLTIQCTMEFRAIGQLGLSTQMAIELRGVSFPPSIRYVSLKGIKSPRTRPVKLDASSGYKIWYDTFYCLQVEEELLLKRSMASDDRNSGFSLSGLGGIGGSGGVEITDDEAGGVIAGGSGSGSSRKSWTNARR